MQRKSQSKASSRRVAMESAGVTVTEFAIDRVVGHAIKSAILSGPVRVFSREEIERYSCR